VCYEGGHGVPRDTASALEWIERAAANGHTEAAWRLGMLLLQQKLRSQDGLKWLKQAAEAGHAGAQADLAWAYERGTGVRPQRDASAPTEHGDMHSWEA
jgi:TPR repeat protein